MKKRIIIIGASAGGMSCAAKLRRADENCDISVIEKSPYVATAYCGFAYAAGDIIRDHSMLEPYSPENLAAKYNLSLRVNTLAVMLDAEKKLVSTYNLKTGALDTLPYDVLIIATGAEARVPEFSGNTLPGVFVLRSVSDAARVHSLATSLRGDDVLIVGSGFIGLELAEAMRHLGLGVHLLDTAKTVLPYLDEDMSVYVRNELYRQGVSLVMGASVREVQLLEGGRLRVQHTSGTLDVGMVLLAAGVYPSTQLAASAGLALGQTGGLKVDSAMRVQGANDIYAVGDVVETHCLLTRGAARATLAVPLARQVDTVVARISGKDAEYKGATGTTVCKVFGLNVGATGLTETRLQGEGIPYRAVTVVSPNHVTFYPGAKDIVLKLLVSPDGGKVLGAQAVGGEGVDKRIDVLASCLQIGASVAQVADLELAYAPPYGAPRDIVNIAAGAALKECQEPSFVTVAQYLGNPQNYTVLDIRSDDEYDVGHIPGAVSAPLESLRKMPLELAKDRPVLICCRTGASAETARAYLRSRGWAAFNLAGGFKAWREYHYQPAAQEESMSCGGLAQAPGAGQAVPQAGGQLSAPAGGEGREEAQLLDVRGMSCPGPIVALSKRLKTMSAGGRLTVLATDPGFVRDVQAWCKQKRHQLLDVSEHNGQFKATLVKAE